MSKNGKNGKPDKNDAHLLVELYNAQATHNVQDAMGFVFSNENPDNFEAFRAKYPRGSSSSQERLLYKALGFFETVGTLYRNGLINEDLLFDWLAVDFVWNRVKYFVDGMREETGSARMYENFEYMAAKNAKWSPSR
jgi:hypothetical protein